MTAQPHLPATLLTVAQYAALGEDDDRLQLRSELQEGSIVMSPRPTPDHIAAMVALVKQLDGQLPGSLELLPELDIDLELTAPDEPGTVRTPDIVVARRAGRLRARAEGGLIKASEVALVVEIISPGSKRMDNVIKRGEYADAGIPHYWIVDILPPISLLVCHLSEEFGYIDGGAVTGQFRSTEPFDLCVDLNTLID
jgi:Uma2 family endonuclease